MLLLPNILIVVLVFVFGAVIGSFLNVLIYRLPLKLDFVKGSSFCPNCKHKLEPLDLVPILSYLLLGRRCRYCHEVISPRYALIELAGGLLALASWMGFMATSSPEFGASFFGTFSFTQYRFIATPPLLDANTAFLGAYAPMVAAVLYFLVLCVLLVVACIDIDTMEIPNGLVIALLVLAVAAIFVGPEVSILSRFIGLVCISVPLLIITLVVPGAFGGGDVKLMAAAGFFLGWQCALVAAFIGIILGGAYGISLLVTHKKSGKEHFAFGPALCAGIAVALFFGPALVRWYAGLL